MEKLLLSLRAILPKQLRSVWAALLLLAMLTASNSSYAQVYFSTNDANSNATGDDAYYKMNYDGSNRTTVSSGLINLTINFALDGNNNRLFVYEAKPGSLAIKVLNLTTGALIRTIPISNEIKDMEYDPRTDYLYYITEGGDGAVTTAADAVNRVHGDGSGQEVFVASLCLNPYRLELDMTNNRLIVYQSNFSPRRLYFIDIPTKTVTFRSFAGSLNTVWDIAYDETNDYIYYVAEGGNGGAISSSDQLRRQKSDGTGDVVLISSFLNSPFRIALDEGNNRLFVNDSYYAVAKIVSVNLNDNTYATVTTTGQTSTSATVVEIQVPRMPSATTASATSVSSASATLGGTLVYGYGLSTERGVVYSSTNTVPTLSDSKASMATNTSNGAYSASVSGLTPSTTYYARAYAVNGAGTSYGAVTSFTTSSNDANLSAFSISAGTLNPTFNAGVTSYTASVANATSSITITPTRNQGSATIKVNGVVVNSGSASGAIALNVGGNVITTVVTAQDGTTTKTYTLTVTRAQNPQTITFNALPAKTYGDADFAPGATSSAGLTVSYSSDNTAVATIVSNQVHIVGVGTANITASQAGDANTLAASPVVKSLTVSPKTITVTATAQTKVYGDNDPALTYTATGVVGSDAPTGALQRVAGVDVGTYAINQGTLSYGGNYNITYTGANLTITKRPITLLPVARTKVYGDADPYLNAFSVTAGSIAPGDATADKFGRVAGENVGVYLLSLGDKKFIRGGTIVNDNYDITIQPAYFTITAKPVTVNAYSQTKTYGDADPEFTYTNSGLAFTDTFTGALTRAAGENVGTYAINQGTLALNSNYAITYVGANLSIGAKTINVTANAQTKGYGDADPVFTYSADALGNGDTFSGTLSRDAGEELGSYAIKQGTLALSSNYTIAFTGSSLTIGVKNITVIADAKTKVYGNNDPALTYTTDVPLAAGNSFTGSLTRAEGKNVGNYAITQGTLALNSNYNVNYTGANLTITKRPIGIAPVPRTKVYGDPNPNIPYQLTGTVAPGEGMTGQFEIAGGENVGEHAILLGAKTPIDIGTAAYTINNYDITFTPGVLTITAKPITVTADAQTKHFSDADPALTYTTNVPLVSGDSFTGSLTREVGEAIGTYAINQGSLALSTNYALTYAGANLAITPSDNANLSALVFDGITLNPEFSSSVTNYSTEVDPYFFQVAVTPTAAQANAQISVNGVSVPSGQTQYIPLYSGPNTINTAVTAQDGTTTKTYTTVVTKKLDTDAKLAGLFFFDGGTSLSPNFDPDVHNYTMDIPNSTASLRIVPYPNSIFATIEVNGAPYNGYLNPYLQPGSNVFTIKVIAEESSISETYTLTVNRALSSNNFLGLLTLTNATLSPAFNREVLNYTASVDNGTYSAALQAYPADTTARYKVNGVSPATPWEDFPVTFNVGDNHYNIDVTAKNGDVRRYTLIVNRAPSTNSSLSNLTVSNGTLSPYFEGQSGPFAVTVPFNLSAISVTPTLQEPYSTVTVNGAEVVSGSPSQNIALNYGANQINVVVTAQDGTTTSQYTIVVTRPAPSTNASLSVKLDPSSTLVGTSIAGKINYTTSVDAGITSVRVLTTAQNANTVILLNGSVLQSGVLSDPIALNPGQTVVQLIATAEDGITVKTYTITINRNGSSNANVGIGLTPASVLVATTGTSSVNYVTSVDASTSSIRVIPTAQDASAVIRLNGTVVQNGVPSNPIALNAGVTVIQIQSTAPDGVTVKTYSITVNRNGSSNANISIGLTPAASLVSTTGTSLVNYVTSVDAGVNSIRLTATAQDANAMIRLNGIAIQSGVLSDPIVLDAGPTVIQLTVLAQDGVTVKTYSVTVNRNGSNNANIGIKLTPASVLASTTGTSTINYVTSVAAGVSSVSLVATAQDANAVIRLNGTVIQSGAQSDPIVLNAGSTVIQLAVTAQDGVTVRTYSITVNRNGSSNASIGIKLTPASNLVASTGSNSFNYTTSVDAGAGSIRLTATAQEANAVIRLNGTVLQSGVLSAPIPLTGSATAIQLVVTAQDGVTVKTYGITVNRSGSNNANASLKLSPAVTLTGTTGSASVNYAAEVSASTSSIQVKATTQSATIKVNGITVADNTFSNAIPLNEGGNLINIEIKAQDGVTIKTYSINVTRLSNSMAVNKTDRDLFYTNKSNNSIAARESDIIVHAAVSPNGDGSNDFLVIEGLSDFANNKLSIMNTSGNLVYETKDYGKDGTNVFDGHSNKNGALLKPGTYYYQLEYQGVDKTTKRKTGYVIVKY